MSLRVRLTDEKMEAHCCAHLTDEKMEAHGEVTGPRSHSEAVGGRCGSLFPCLWELGL